MQRVWALPCIWATAFVVLYNPFVSLPHPWYQVGNLYAGATAGCLVAGFLHGFLLYGLGRIEYVMYGWWLAVLTVAMSSPLLFMGYCVQSQGCYDWPVWSFAPCMVERLEFHSAVFLLLIVPALATIGFWNGAQYRKDRRITRVAWISALAVLLGALFCCNEIIFNLLPKHTWAEIVYASR